MSIIKRYFGKIADGREAELFIINNSNGMKVELTNYGATVVSIKVPDKNGKIEDVVLGYENLEGYLKGNKYFGATVGRCCNRIENSKFNIDGREYKVTQNEGKNHLHGGKKGLDKVLWESNINCDKDNVVEFYYMSEDGEEGYPGNLHVKVIYTLTNDNALKIEYKAISDKDTIVSLTNHSYFNLSGNFQEKIFDHKLMIKSNEFTVNNEESVSNGEIRCVKETPMDFRELTVIRNNINSDYDQLKIGHGYDQNWILEVDGKVPLKVSELIHDNSGRIMEVYTTYPGIQVYTANFFDGTDIGRNGIVYKEQNSICLETQYSPNSINHNKLTTPFLRKNEEYYHTTVYKFSIINE
jgi:Galactose mutarotase and related enzymes